MGLILFVRWWYGAGWANSFLAIEQRVRIFAQELSMGILLRTLFEPWKQITLYAGENASIDAKIHVFFDNIFSRFFGFFIRTFMLLIGCIGIVVVFVFGTLLAIAWPIVPLLPFICIFLAVQA